METKICSKCKQELKLTSEFFNKETASKDGFQRWCKNCCRAYETIYFKVHKEERKQYGEKRKEHTIAYNKLYNQEHKEHRAVFGKLYRQEHKEHRATLMKQYYKENKEHISKYLREYQKEHLDKVRIYNHSRKSEQQNLPHTLTTMQWDLIKQSFNNCCAYCGEELPLTQDHFIPLSKGGEYTHDNIIPTCGSCNSSKNKNDFFEWYLKQSFYSKKREQKICKFLHYEGEVQQLALNI